MSDLATLYQRNAEFAAGFDQGDLPIKPKLSTLILACVDARVGPEHVMGVELGDCLILRTVGGRVTEGVGTEVAMLWMLMSLASGATPDMELVIVQHTECGMARFAVPEVAEKVTERFGTPDVVATYGISNLEEAVVGDVQRILSNPVIPPGLRVSGHIYDIKTGELREIVGTRTVESPD